MKELIIGQKISININGQNKVFKIIEEAKDEKYTFWKETKHTCKGSHGNHKINDKP